MRLAIMALVVAVVVGWVFSALPMGTTGAYPAPYPSPRAYPGLFLPVVFKAAGNSPAPILPTATATAYVWPTATQPPPATATRTPTRTATATATVPACNGSVQALQNTSFETGWYPWTILAGIPTRNTLFAYNGSYSAYLAGYNNASDMIGQPVVVPDWAETAALYFMATKYTQEPPSPLDHDFLYANVVLTDPPTNIGSGYISEQIGENNTWYGWRVGVTNVAAFRGRVIHARFTAQTDSLLATGWWIDGVTMVFACGSATAGQEAQEQLSYVDLEGRTPITGDLLKGIKAPEPSYVPLRGTEHSRN